MQISYSSNNISVKGLYETPTTPRRKHGRVPSIVLSYFFGPATVHFWLKSGGILRSGQSQLLESLQESRLPGLILFFCYLHLQSS
jgi:hypothetical protein